jgi:nitroreductase
MVVKRKITMNLLDIIKNRRSIRSFTKKGLTKAQINMLIDAGRFAPSAGNLESRFFYIVENTKKKIEIAYAALTQMFIAEAPVVIVICADFNAAKPYGARGQLYAIEDASASVENILLTAHSLGLGSCWIGAFDENKLMTILNIPEHHKPIAILPIGYPAEQPDMPPRSRIEDISKFI